MALLEIRDLKVEFATRYGPVTALDGVSLEVEAGETLGVVGESGCGKSITALSVMGLIPSPPGKVAGGSIKLAGEELIGVSDRRLRDLRGSDMAMIFQEPMTSLNPVFTAGDQIAEAIMLHQDVDKGEAFNRAVELLDRVGIPEARRRASDYPHQLSGGMRQRVMIAMAVSCQPKVLIADEPTTALDVTVQAQIFDLLNDIQRDFGTAIIMITHDMGAIAEMADRVAVMYAGKVIEQGMADDILAVVDALGFDRIDAVGHSMGGCATVRAELGRPGLVGRAWLFEPIIFPSQFGPERTTEGDSMMAEAARKRREVFDSVEAVIERYGSRPPFAGVHPEALRAYVEHGFRPQDDGTVILKCRRDTEAAVFMNAQTDTFSRVGEVATPIVVAGSGDGDGPASFAPLVAEALPNGTFEFYEDLTHFAPLEDPDRIAAAITAALELG